MTECYPIPVASVEPIRYCVAFFSVCAGATLGVVLRLCAPKKHKFWSSRVCFARSIQLCTVGRAMSGGGRVAGTVLNSCP